MRSRFGFEFQSHLTLLEQPLVRPESGVRAGQLVLLVRQRLVQLDGEPNL